MILAWIQRWNNSEKLIKLWCRNNYFSCDPHFMILVKVQNWSIYEELTKLCSPPDFFHKSMSHEQLLLTWSTFRDSSMGTKLKYFWKTHESVKSAWIFSQKHVSRTIIFHVIHISWFQHGYKVEIFLKNSWKCVVRLNFFTKCGSHEKWLFVRHVFVKKFWRTTQFHEFFKYISTLYPC